MRTKRLISSRTLDNPQHIVTLCEYDGRYELEVNRTDEVSVGRISYMRVQSAQYGRRAFAEIVTGQCGLQF